MSPIVALRTAFALSVGGSIFSGVLTYRELFATQALSCPAVGAPGTILGYPACVYGFGIFVLLALVTASGLRQSRSRDHRQLPPAMQHAWPRDAQ